MVQGTSGKKFLVVGATGNVGGLVAPGLLERGEHVRCLVRSEARAVSSRELGAEVVVGNLDDRESLSHAFAGIDTVFLVTSVNQNAVQQGKNAIDAASDAAVGRIVRYSAIKTDVDKDLAPARMHLEVEAALEDSGISTSYVRPSTYMQGLMMAIPTIQTDSAIYMPWGSGEVGMADLRDIAEAAIQVLVDDAHAGKAFSITGPEAINLHQAALAISDAIGKEVNYVDVPPGAAREGMLAMGLDAWLVGAFLDYFDAYKNGHGSVVTDDFTRLTGRPSRSISDFARDHAGAFNPELVASGATSEEG